MISLRNALDAKAAVGVQPLERPGLDGTGYLLLPARFRPSVLTAELDAAVPETTIDALAALAGTVVTAVDDKGTSYTNVLVLGVEYRGCRHVATPVGGVVPGGAHVMVVEFTVVQTGSV